MTKLAHLAEDSKAALYMAGILAIGCLTGLVFIGRAIILH
jgi:hypothetical protein